jgi:hypothetical protein
MKIIKSFNQFESLTDKIYHFTYLINIYNILNTNNIYLTPVFSTKSDNKLNQGKLYALSLTSSRNAEIGYAGSLPDDGKVRITFDGHKLNQNHKSKRIDYWQRPKDPKNPIYNSPNTGTGKSFYKFISRQDELEDRIISDKNTIKNANKYILSIDILVKKDYKNDISKKEKDDKYIGNIKRLCREQNITFNVYNDEKYFSSNIINKAINVKELNSDIESRKDSSLWIEDLIAILIYKDEKIKNKVNEYIKDNLNIFENYNNLNRNIKKELDNLSYRLRYPNDYVITDKSRTLEAHISNNKRNHNKHIKYIINQIGLDMKKK